MSALTGLSCHRQFRDRLRFRPRDSPYGHLLRGMRTAPHGEHRKQNRRGGEAPSAALGTSLKHPLASKLKAVRQPQRRIFSVKRLYWREQIFVGVTQRESTILPGNRDLCDVSGKTIPPRRAAAAGALQRDTVLPHLTGIRFTAASSSSRG